MLPLLLQDDANEWKRRYDEDNGISDSMHDAPAAAPRLTTPVGTADEDHVGSMADLVSLLFPCALPAIMMHRCAQHSRVHLRRRRASRLAKRTCADAPDVHVCLTWERYLPLISRFSLLSPRADTAR